MSRATKATVLFACALAFASIAGCGRQVVKEPGPVQKVVVKEYVRLPKEHLKKCPIEYIKERNVSEAVRVLNYNTASLEKCAQQIIEIIKLQPDDK